MYTDTGNADMFESYGFTSVLEPGVKHGQQKMKECIFIGHTGELKGNNSCIHTHIQKH